MKHFTQEEKERAIRSLNTRGIKAELVSVPKNNGIMLDGITLGDGPVRPTLYFQNFENIEEMVNYSVDVLENVPTHDFGISDIFKHYDLVKAKSGLKLTKKPAEGLAYIPAFADLYQTAYILLSNKVLNANLKYHPSMDTIATVGIREEHLEMIGVTKEQLFADALETAKKFEPPTLTNLDDILSKHSLSIDSNLDFYMRVLTNSSMHFGASAALYYEHFEEGTIIIPSSVHELILLNPRDFDEDDKYRLNNIIQEVNKTVISPEEVLSDHAYIYKSRQIQSL